MALTRVQRVEPITINHYTLTATGLTVKGRPSYEEHQGVGDFIQRSVRASGFWMADWLRYGESRADWSDRLDQAVESTGLSEGHLKNIRRVAKIEPSRRRDDVEFSLHAEVAGMKPNEQTDWLEQCALHGWTQRELRLNIRADRKSRIIEGQAVLEGLFRVVYADPPWAYGRAAGMTSQADHYAGMTIDALCKLPVQAHTYKDAVLFMWVTAPMLYESPGPREVIQAWGFTPKTGIVWDKVSHNFGNYVSVRHEHLIIATRGSCTPDRPTPMPDSVQTERQDGEHSSKPAMFRKLIEQLYDGPYLELFARERIDGWACFGNDAALWHQDMAASAVMAVRSAQ
jgi:N6-adenosine-specific RNA methylase IME4